MPPNGLTQQRPRPEVAMISQNRTRQAVCYSAWFSGISTSKPLPEFDFGCRSTDSPCN
jgi:hypothetical protein